MYRLAFKNFIRSKSVAVALILFLVVGIISIYIGKQFIGKQQTAVNAVTTLQHKQIERNVNNAYDQFGLLMYYLRFAYINKPESLASLAIGQQDVNSSIQYLTIRGLEGQRYDTDLFNPYNQLTGNLDLSFVILFLFPLLIIAFNFNVLSQEAENGTWSLIRVQVDKPLKLILNKLSIRLIVILVLLFLLLTMAVIIIGIPLNERLFAYTVTAILYISFWFAVSFLIIVFRFNSSISALVMLSSWVLLCLLGPAIVNNYLTSAYPVNEAYNTLLKQRDGYHTKWDKNQDSTLQIFLKHYPRYSHYKWDSPKFNYMWYYAMQQLGDDEAAADSKVMYEKLHQRQHAADLAALLVPSMHAQLQFTDIAGTGLKRQLQYLDSTAVFHENTKLHFYPKIFGDSTISSENWSQYKPQYFHPVDPIGWGALIMPFVISILIMTGAGVWIFNRNYANPQLK
jgi:ABC-2 type transport system permease protein